MLLQALHKYAEQRKLLERLPFQVRTVHLLIPLKADGTVRGQGFVPLTTPVTVGGKTKEKPGQRMILPRFPGEKNNTRAQYLCDPLRVVLGLVKDSSDAFPDNGSARVPEGLQQHRMFWRWVDEARHRLSAKGIRDKRLDTIDAFFKSHLESVRQWAMMWTNPNARKPEPEIVVKTIDDNRYRLSDGDVVGFEIDGLGPFVLMKGDSWSEALSQVSEDPVWSDWRNEYRTLFAKEVGDDHLGVDQPSLCIVTGATGLQIAEIHKPEIKIDGTPPKGASFFSVMTTGQSFGKGTAGTASVSVDAAASYALAFEELLASDDTRLDIGGVTFCFWAEKNPVYASANARLLRAAIPSAVANFLKEPFSGVDRGLAKKDSFLSVAISANGGRIMVREWLRVPLDEAIDNFAKWFSDLEIDSLFVEKLDDSERGGPLSLFHLAEVLVRERGELERMSEAITLLYRAAIEGTAPPVRLLSPLLAEFQSALVNNTAKKRKYPFNQSRFALLKLILLRNPKGDFVPKAHLCETDDEAYNLGRLLCVLAALQDAAHDYELEGPGVVERYYGSASTAPANVFGVLWKLHVHHLRKLEQSEKGRKTAYHIRGRLSEIIGQFAPAGEGLPPRFPATLSLEAQGRFALGFYQQLAADRKAIREATALKNAAAQPTNTTQE
ncbi:MAG: type I-C CRISPR-associated protein Cas8c/Csd1 [Fimbriiglobus sp.]